MKKIAFCFLIYDIINHEELWNIFFKDIDPNLYNIYIHYKNNKQLKYFEKYKLDNCIPTQYSHISIVHAQNVILKKALQDKDNEHFIFISNSCVPLKNFDHVYNSLNKEYSYFNVCPQMQCFPRCNPSLKMVNREFIQKSHQWCILNRKHANIMVNNDDYLNWFSYGNLPGDEHCYISKLYYEKLQTEIIATMNTSCDATTFTNWEGMDYKYPSRRGLQNYRNISEDELLYLLNSKCLFGRKFLSECITSLCNHKYIECIKSK